MVRFAIGAMALLAFASAAVAVQKKAPPTSPLIAKIGACRSISDDAQRLACFDRESDALVSAVTSGNIALVEQSQVRETRRSLFGFSIPRIPFFSGDKSADEATDTLESTIRSVTVVSRNRYQMVIADHGAVWENIDTPMRLMEPRPGQKIVIKRGAIGAYFLRIDGQIGVKGRRIR